jgi:hypothetical protein
MRMGLGVLREPGSGDAPPKNWALKRRYGIMTFEPE